MAHKKDKELEDNFETPMKPATGIQIINRRFSETKHFSMQM